LSFFLLFLLDLGFLVSLFGLDFPFPMTNDLPSENRQRGTLKKAFAALSLSKDKTMKAFCQAVFGLFRPVRAPALFFHLIFE